MAPLIISRYELGFTVPQVRSRISEEFRKNMQEKKLQTVDFLVFKGTCELEELVNQWKTKSHVLSYFTPPKDQSLQNDFYSSFFSKRT